MGLSEEHVAPTAGRKVCQLAVGFAEEGGLKVGAFQVAVAHNGFAGVATVKVGSPKIRVTQIRLEKNGARQVGPLQAGAVQLDLVQDRAAQIGAEQPGPIQPGPIEQRAAEYIEKIDELGGAVTAIENGFQQREIQQAAYVYQQAVEADSEIVVGVNGFTVDEDEKAELLKLDPENEARQRQKVEDLRARRDNEAVEKALARVSAAAKGTDNLMPAIVDAVRVYATLGEISDAMREVYGGFTPPTFV